MMNKRNFLTLSGSALLLAGCGDLLGPPQAAPVYALRPEFPVMPATKVNWSLSVMRPSTSAFLDSDRIALTQPNGVMDYYAGAQYPDSLPALVQSSLVSAFERSAAIGSLSREAEALQSDYYLFTDIRAFEARYAVQDGVPDVVVTLGARLVTTLGRSTAGNTVITKTVRAAANTVGAVTAALTEAMAGVTSEIVTWALAFPAPPPQK
jgi:cholesterol transport system auxiliary component